MRAGRSHNSVECPVEFICGSSGEGFNQRAQDANIFGCWTAENLVQATEIAGPRRGLWWRGEPSEAGEKVDILRLGEYYS